MTTRSGPTPGARATCSSRRRLSIDRAWLSSLGSCFDRQHDRVAAHESRDVVDVPVRVVADAALAEPDRVADAEPLGEHLFVVVAREAGVAHLHVAQQPLLGDEQQSVAVDLDAAALEHDAAAGRPARCGSSRRSDVMAAMAAPTFASRGQLSYFAQALNAQFEQDDVAGRIEHAGRRRVAQPDAIGRHDVQADAIAADGVRVEDLARRRANVV